MKVRQLQRFNEPLSDNNNRRRRSTFTGAKVPQAQQAQRVEDNDIMSPNEVTVNMGLQMGKKRMTITLDKLSATTSMSGPSGMNGSSSFGTGEQRSSQFMPPGGAGHRLSLRSPIKLSDLAKDPTGQAFRSSKVFQPEKYLKTRGISVSFEGGEDRSSPNGEVKTIRTNVRQSSLMVICSFVLILLLK